MANTAIVSRREAVKAINNMTPPLRKMYNDIRDKVGSLATRDIMTRYDVGEKINLAMSDARLYGAKAAEQLSSALGISLTELYMLKLVAVTWKRDAVVKLSQRKSSAGGNLTFTHLSYLASSPDAKTRRSLTSRCFNECLTVRDLHALVREAIGSDRTSNGRPRMALPRSSSAGLALLSKMARTLVSSQSVFDTSIFEPLIETPSLEASAKMLSRLEEVDAELAKLEDTVTANRRKIGSAKAAVAKAMQSKRGETRPSSKQVRNRTAKRPTTKKAKTAKQPTTGRSVARVKKAAKKARRATAGANR